MDTEKIKALEDKLLRLFEEQRAKSARKDTLESGTGDIIRRRKGKADKRLETRSAVISSLL